MSRSNVAQPLEDQLLRYVDPVSLGLQTRLDQLGNIWIIISLHANIPTGDLRQDHIRRSNHVDSPYKSFCFWP